MIAKEQSSSKSEILDPKHEIITEKLRRLGMEFGGRPLVKNGWCGGILAYETQSDHPITMHKERR